MQGYAPWALIMGRPVGASSSACSLEGVEQAWAISIEVDVPYAIVLIEDKHKFYSSSSVGKRSGKLQRGFDYGSPRWGFLFRL